MSFCANCGKELTPNAQFCSECGSPVSNQVEASKIIQPNLEKGEPNLQSINTKSSVNEGKTSSLALFKFFGVVFLLYLIIPRLVCDIDPFKEYSFLVGIWHGLFFVPNWIMSLFFDVFYKSYNSSGFYDFVFWITAIIVSGSLIYEAIVLLLALMLPTKQDKIVNKQKVN